MSLKEPSRFRRLQYIKSPPSRNAHPDMNLNVRLELVKLSLNRNALWKALIGGLIKIYPPVADTFVGRGLGRVKQSISNYTHSGNYYKSTK